MSDIYFLLLAIFVIGAGYFAYTRLSGVKTLERYTKKAQASVKTDEDIRRMLMTCIIMNGKEHSSFEEIEVELKTKAQSMEELESKGFGSEIYNQLNDTQRSIYLLINGYDLQLIPQYLQVKAINAIGNPKGP